MNHEYKTVLGTIAAECAKNSIAFKLENKRLVGSTKEAKGSVGYFSEVDRELVVATRNKLEDWFRVLIHEWMHMKQWKSGMFTKKLDKVYEDLWDWVDKTRELPEKRLVEVIAAARDLERDAEERTIEYLRLRSRWLGIDVDDYARKANAYLYFYEALKRTRKWYTKPPYTIDKIVERMPVSFNRDYTRLPSEYLKLVKKHCI